MTSIFVMFKRVFTGVLNPLACVLSSTDVPPWFVKFVMPAEIVVSNVYVHAGTASH